MSLLNSFLLVFAGGGLGSVARFGTGKLTSLFYDGKFPVATLLANTLACAVLGAVVFLLREKLTEQEWVRYFILIGFCGGFSTFSAFGFETVKLVQDGFVAYAIVNVLVSIALGFGILFLLVR